MAHGSDSPLQPISVTEHRERILATVAALAPVTVPLTGALGLVLAADVTADIDVPGFDNSAMDGFAVRFADVETASATSPVTLSVIADLPAGSAENPPLGPGQAARIMTGSAIPDDADCIVPVEHTESDFTTFGKPNVPVVDGSSAGEMSALGDVRILHAPTPAAHIRRTGTDVREGEPVLTTGRTLNARDLAAAAATGASTLLVHPAPRVGVLSTGSELVVPGEQLHRGQIHDSNSTLLAALVAECGAIPVQLGSVPDDESALRSVLQEFAPTLDAVVTSGGVSVGAYDVVKAVLAPLGIWFGPVRMQPGKPQGFGGWPADGRAMPSAESGTPIFALPGNPVSVFVSFEAFVRPALRAMQGQCDVLREAVQAVVAEGWRSPKDRAQFMPAFVEPVSDTDHTLSVRPASSGGSGSYLVASLARANALAIIPESVTEVHAGDLVSVTLVS